MIKFDSYVDLWEGGIRGMEGTREGMQDEYLKWVLGLNEDTPGYMVREKTKRDKLREEAGKRTIKFE